jgi:hypothetical protein
MPGFPLTVGTTASCLHQGPATVAAGQSAVLILGQPAATSAAQIMVAGCIFTLPNGKPQPCTTVRWLNVSTKVLVQGQPLLLEPPPGTGVGPGICQSAEQIPQGAPTVQMNQTKVLVT